MRTNYFFSVKNLLTGFGILCISFSCKKETDDNCSATVVAIAGTYKVTALSYKETSSSPAQNYMLFREDCEQDDRVVLGANGSYTYKDEGTVCSPDGTNTGSWSIVGNTIISDGIVAGTIQSFDCNSLVVYTDNIIIPGDKITLTITKQ